MNTPYVFKKCNKCGRWLVASKVNFSKNKNGKYGLHSWCKECVSAYNRKYYTENNEHKAKYNKKYRETPRGQSHKFNNHIKRRQREEQQGNGLTGQQWLEMMNFFDWKCAYSGECIGGTTNSNRTIDHIVPLAKGGAHEVWNLVPMYGSYNFSKNNKTMEEWYPQQDFYDEDKLNKINKWCKYAYNKWGKEVNTKTI